MLATYDLKLVVLSLVIPTLASWMALDLSSRVHAQVTKIDRTLWLGSGAVFMGLGIWAMHYIGMLSLRSDISVLYHWPTVVVSLLAALVFAFVALCIANRPRLTSLTTIAAGLVMGGGIAAMHYIGIVAMRVSSAFHYSYGLVALSLILAVVISMVSLRLYSSAKRDTNAWSSKKILSAFLMATAVSSMHYVGMAAVQMVPSKAAVLTGANWQHTLPVSQLEVGAAIGMVMIAICFALLLSSINRTSLEAEDTLTRVQTEHDELNDYQQRLIKAYRQNGVGAWQWDSMTDRMTIDAGIRRIYDLDESVGGQIERAILLKRVHEDDLNLVHTRWNEALTSVSHYDSEYRIQHRDGSIHHCRVVATVSRSTDSGSHSVYGMAWDVTTEHEQQQHIAEQASRFHRTLEAIGEAVLSVDGSQVVTYANPVACVLIGLKAEECIGRKLSDVFVTEDEFTGEIRRSAVERCIELGGQLLSEDGILVSSTGRRYNIQKHVNLVDGLGSAVLTFQDITVSRQLKRELQYAATHDKLTGLPNRAAFEAHLRHAWEAERENGRLHCLALVDLDRFKLVNDTAGHLAGDALLKAIAELLKSHLQRNDFLSRMGGDEFMLLLRDVEPTATEKWLDQLRDCIERFQFVWLDRVYSVSASIGMVFFDRHSLGMEALITHADVALYTSKRNGRNRSARYDVSSGQAAGNLQEMVIAAAIRDALSEGRFELHAQPIVPLRFFDNCTYFELLVRMRDLDGNLVPPVRFIPAAECYGLMQLIDRWVVENALRAYGSDPRLSNCVRFAINISADSLSDPTFWPFVARQFAHTGAPPKQFTFEVTESGLISNLETATKFLHSAQEAGCQIALDDFGTGMSSLSYLKAFPLDVIKIEGSFVKELLHTPLDQSIVKAVTEVAHCMGAIVIAECAEDMKTVELLRTFGVDMVQGFATGRPMPLIDAIRSVGRSSSAYRDGPTGATNSVVFYPPIVGAVA